MSGQSSVFVGALVKRLTATKEAIVLRPLLQMLQHMLQHHVNPKAWVAEHNLLHVVREVSQSEGQVLVFSTAKTLLTDFQRYT